MKIQKCIHKTVFIHFRIIKLKNKQTKTINKLQNIKLKYSVTLRLLFMRNTNFMYGVKSGFVIAVVNCCWEILTWVTDFSSYPHLLVIFNLFVEAAKELRTERKETGILLISILYFTDLQLFCRGEVRLDPGKAVYSVERRKEFWERVSFWRQDAHLFRHVLIALPVRGLLENSYFCIYLFYFAFILLLFFKSYLKKFLIQFPHMFLIDFFHVKIYGSFPLQWTCLFFFNVNKFIKIKVKNQIKIVKAFFITFAEWYSLIEIQMYKFVQISKFSFLTFKTIVTVAPFAKSKIAAVRQHVCSARRNGNKKVKPSNGVTCVTGRCAMVMCTQL